MQTDKILKLIDRYYIYLPKAKYILLNHSESVSKKALEIATNLKLSLRQKEFIRKACLLHDIGIFMVYAPSIGCNGEKTMCNMDI